MKREVLQRVLTLVLALVFVGSAAMILRQLHHRRQAVESQETALQIAFPDPAPTVPAPDEPTAPTQSHTPDSGESPQNPPDDGAPDEVPPSTVEPEPTPVPEPVQSRQSPDLEALRQINEDVFGWIHLPDTVISYPLVKSRDNAEYLNLTWDKQKSRSGSIFLECRSSTDLTDFHALIYGHNWKDGIMFSPLLQYADPEFADSHRNFYLITDDAVLQYTVFSAYTANVVSDTYRIFFEDDARRQACIDFWKSRSVIATDLTPAVTDRILTLSTCTGRGVEDIRWVVHTVLTETYPR